MIPSVVVTSCHPTAAIDWLARPPAAWQLGREDRVAQSEAHSWPGHTATVCLTLKLSPEICDCMSHHLTVTVCLTVKLSLYVSP